MGLMQLSLQLGLSLAGCTLQYPSTSDMLDHLHMFNQAPKHAHWPW